VSRKSRAKKGASPESSDFQVKIAFFEGIAALEGEERAGRKKDASPESSDFQVKIASFEGMAALAGEES
jgi:hypothetical protein